jgi:hypothetical protein
MTTNDVRMLSSTILILAAAEVAKIRDAGIAGLALAICGAYVFIQAYRAQKGPDSKT